MDEWMNSHDEHIEKSQVDTSHLTPEETKKLRKMSSHLNLGTEEAKSMISEANKLKEEESAFKSPRELHTKSQLTERHAAAFGSAMRSRSENQRIVHLPKEDNDGPMKSKSSSSSGSSGIFCCSSERNDDSNDDTGGEGCIIS